MLASLGCKYNTVSSTEPTVSNPELTRYNIGHEDMAQSRVLRNLAEFQAGTDSVDEYVDRFKLYRTANDVADNDKQRAIFLEGN